MENRAEEEVVKAWREREREREQEVLQMIGEGGGVRRVVEVGVGEFKGLVAGLGEGKVKRRRIEGVGVVGELINLAEEEGVEGALVGKKGGRKGGKRKERG
ncbi:hypothetical protein MMC21_007158 [Puttea exsequens]|nr:hypothetical protein [Puttea exsequens]